MKKLIQILPILILACTNQQSEVKESYLDTTTPVSDTILTPLEKTEQMLETSTGLENKIQETYKTKEVLVSENNNLKLVLKVTKDSLISKEHQLKETIKKIPNKKNLIERVLNIGPDSIEITE
jgi:hypothetical protein